MDIALLADAIRLLNLRRYNAALQELERVLTASPLLVRAICLKALIYMKRNRTREALENAHKAVSIDARDDYAQHVLALVQMNCGHNLHQAEIAVKTALSLNPEVADYYDTLAIIQLTRGRYDEALRLCDQGLQLDPADKDCRRTRRRILAARERYRDNLDKKDTPSELDSEQSQSLSDSGWSGLEQGDYRGALENFKDALKMQPDNQYAREGLLQSLKARHSFFRLFLRYTTAVNNLNPAVRWILVIGLIVLVRFNSQLPAALFIPLLVVLGLLVVSIWFIDPLLGMLLLFNRYGRQSLGGYQKISAASVLAGFLLAAGSLALALLSGQSYFYIGALAALCLIIPAKVVFENLVFHRKYRRAGITLFWVLTALFAAGYPAVWLEPTAGLVCWTATILGTIAISWATRLTRG